MTGSALISGHVTQAGQLVVPAASSISILSCSSWKVWPFQDKASPRIQSCTHGSAESQSYRKRAILDDVPSIRKESPGGHVLCKAPASVMLCSENVGTRRGAGEQKSSHFPIKFSLTASYAQEGPQAILFSLRRCCSHVLCCVMCSNQDANNTHQYKSSCVPFWLDRIWAQAAVGDQF